MKLKMTRHYNLVLVQFQMLLKALKHKKNLGIHTEMLSDGLINLVKDKVVTGNKKSIYQKHVCSFILGTKELYDYVHLNKDIFLMSASIVNDPMKLVRIINKFQQQYHNRNRFNWPM